MMEPSGAANIKVVVQKCVIPNVFLQNTTDIRLHL